jgi:GT2 family glycosyltransferase
MAAAISVVVPTWNRRALLERLLADLRHQSLAAREVIVVDNGSSDGSAEAARKAGAVVLRLETNRGFAAAVNQGVGSATAEWVAIVNNDVTLSPDYLARLRDGGIQHHAAIVAGKLLSSSRPDLLDGTYDLVSRGCCALRAGNGWSERQFPAGERETDFLPFTAVVVRREVFLSLQGLDERFESYLEDVDFCLRARVAGHRCWYVPTAVGWHDGGQTLGPWSPAMVRRISRNQVWLAAKHLPAQAGGFPVLAGQLLWGMLAMRHLTSVAWLTGKLEGLWRHREFRPSASPAAHAVLARSEGEIAELQQKLGFDWYWRQYFRWVGRS